jgi:predicted nucleotide-binding protein
MDKLKIEPQLALAQFQKQVEAGEALLQEPMPHPKDFERISSSVDGWHERNKLLVERIYDGHAKADSYFMKTETAQMQEKNAGAYPDAILRGFVKAGISFLDTCIEGLKLDTELANKSGIGAPPAERVFSKKIFIVHGHNVGFRDAVARFISKIELEPLILGEQASEGKTIIEKFEKHADTPFAVVLMTSDEIASTKQNPETKEKRARPNVVLELGYFIGKLGRDRVVVLKEKNVAVLSDFHGVIYIELDTPGAWQMLLAKELKAAGIRFNAEKAF